MAKTKNKKKSLSDKVRSKKQNTNIKVNPFEVKINKQKHDVLGKKVAKFDKGRPGVSKSKAMQKRKETLLEEYKKKDKANTLVDKRIGENDTDLTVEDKMLQRFALERQRYHEKPGMFNLNEEDTLTHYGQSLAEIEKFDEPDVSDEEYEDDEGKGKIGAKMVAEEHFGGGILKKSQDSGDGKHKSWKEKMEEIIAKSKKEKYERQHEKEKTREMTEQLDKDWKDLRFAMASLRKDKDDTEVKKKADDYDIVVRELQFEMKGKASDRMKTDEEIAKDEKERLEKLEADRVRRMKGLTPEEEDQNSRQRKHMSADDLDDGFDLSPSNQFVVRYKDGKLVTENSDEGSEQSDSEDEEEDGDSEDESDDDDKEPDDLSDGKNDKSLVEKDDEDGSDSDSDPMAHLSDLESDDDVSDNEDQAQTKQTDSQQKQPSIVETNKSSDQIDIKDLLKKKKKVMDEARKELPYVFKAPEKYEDLLELLKDHNQIDQVIVIERIRTCHHPSLAEGNKTRLETLFQFVLRYYGDLALHQPPEFKLMDKLVIHLYELCQLSPLPAGQAVLELVIEKQAEYSQRCEARNGRGLFPTLDVMMFFKLISMLFPTSDLKHPVVTPTLLFMSQIITQSQVQTTRDVASGLLLCNLFLEYVSFSKRFVPEVVNFLRGLLFLCIEKTPQKIEPVIPPFKPVGKYTDLLKLKTDQSKCKECIDKMKMNHIYTPQKAFKYLSSDEFKLSSINLTVTLLQKFCALHKDLPAHPEIFQPVCYFCQKLPLEQYPQAVKVKIENLVSSIEAIAKKPRKGLTLAKQRTKALKLYEPKIEEDFDPMRKKHGGGKEKNEKQRLVHKHKRELKGAIREIKKDSQFLATERLAQQIQRDDERKRKVRELFGQLASQEGDYKAMKRQKNKF